MSRLLSAVCLFVAAAAWAAVGAPAGTIPSGMPARLAVGLNEDNGGTWMKNSGAPWDARYRYLTKGWANNWGWSPADGSFAASYLRECQAQGYLPVFSYYQFHSEPGGGESAFLTKAQNATTARAYFSDFRLLMQVAKQYGGPVLVLVEPDGTGLLEAQSGSNPNAYAAVAATGLPELAGLPNTVGGWGQAFVRERDSVVASNVMLGLHVSGWATGFELFSFSTTQPLQPEVDKAYAFLSALGLAQYDVLVADPLDRDADYYRLVRGENRWWDASDTASTSSASFNRWAEWLRLWNVKANKRWVVWQIPEGASTQRNVCFDGSQGSGYKDNRSAYLFGAGSAAHREKLATNGVAALLFGRGEGCQATHETDGDFLKNNAGAFLRGGGLAVPRSSGGTPVGITSSATVSGTTVTATVSNGTGAFILVEVHGATGLAGQQSCASATTCTYAFSAASPGTYTVKLGVFDAAWSLLHWNGSAATFTVSAGGDPARYSFESSAQGWSGGATSATRAFAGARSLAVNVTSSRVSASVASPPIAAGKRVTFHLWVPANANLASVQPYVLESGTWRWTGTWTAGAALVTGAWNTLSVTVPANAGALSQLGLELTASSGWTGTVYLDSVGD